MIILSFQLQEGAKPTPLLFLLEGIEPTRLLPTQDGGKHFSPVGFKKGPSQCLPQAPRGGQDNAASPILEGKHIHEPSFSA